MKIYPALAFTGLLILVITLPFSEISAWCTKYTDIRSHAVFVFVTVTTIEAEFAYNQNAMLRCQVNDASKTYTYSWRKGETPVNEIQSKEKQKYVPRENGSLEIQNPCECIIIQVLEKLLMKTMTKALLLRSCVCAPSHAANNHALMLRILVGFLCVVCRAMCSSNAWLGHVENAIFIGPFTEQ